MMEPATRFCVFFFPIQPKNFFFFGIFKETQEVLDHGPGGGEGRTG